MKLSFSLVIFSSFAFIFNAYGFIDLTRHGYNQCTACHLSPTGGGLLTPYGRELSKELLSTHGANNEQYYLYDTFELKKYSNLIMGGFLRGAQIHRSNARVEEARFVPMQADFEAAYNNKNWAIMGGIGRQEVGTFDKKKGRIFGRRHYFLLRPSDKDNLRIGKFLKSFGINDPNHNLMVRRDLGLGLDTETYNLEYSILEEKFSLVATWATKLFTDKYSRNREESLVLNGQYAFPFLEQNHRFGFSFLLGNSQVYRRKLYSLSGLFGFSEKLHLISEFNYQVKWFKDNEGRKGEEGHVTSQQLVYKLVRGVYPYFLYEEKKLNHRLKHSKTYGMGPGLRFYPRPHLELIAAYQQNFLGEAREKEHFFWLVGQFYL